MVRRLGGVALFVITAFFAGMIPASADYACYDIFALKGPESAVEEFRVHPMKDRYKHELDPETRRVYYLRNDNVRAKYEWKIAQGRLFKFLDGKWQPLNTAVAKKDYKYDESTDKPLVEFVLSTEKQLFGMTRDEHIRVFEETGLNLYHSTFMGGKPVFFAGNVHGENGKVLILSSRSGHYEPPYTDFLIFLKWLEVQGVDIARTLIHVYDIKKLLEDPAAIRDFERYMPEIIFLAEKQNSPEFLQAVKSRIEKEFADKGDSVLLYRANFVWDQLSPTVREHLKAIASAHGIKLPDPAAPEPIY